MSKETRRKPPLLPTTNKTTVVKSATEDEPVKSRKTNNHNKTNSNSSSKGLIVLRLLVILCCLSILFGIGYITYGNYSKAVAARNNITITEEVSTDKKKEEYNKAIQYNKDLMVKPILEPESDDENSRKYKSLLNIDGVGTMGIIRIPKIKVDLPIYHGTDDDTLNLGVGHLYGTSLPVGGDTTLSVLTAHSGLANFSAFDNLPELKKGDKIYVSVMGENLTYQVTGDKVIEPTDTSDLIAESGKDRMILLTCYPYAINSHRWLTFAERVPNEGTQAEVANNTVFERSAVTLWGAFPLWTKIVGSIVIIVMLWHIVQLFRDLHKRRKQKASEPQKPALSSDGKNKRLSALEEQAQALFD